MDLDSSDGEEAACDTDIHGNPLDASLIAVFSDRRVPTRMANALEYWWRTRYHISYRGDFIYFDACAFLELLIEMGPTHASQLTVSDVSPLYDLRASCTREIVDLNMGCDNLIADVLRGMNIPVVYHFKPTKASFITESGVTIDISESECGSVPVFC